MGGQGVCDSEPPTPAKEEVCSQPAAQVPRGCSAFWGWASRRGGGWKQGVQLQGATPGGWEMLENSPAPCELGAGGGTGEGEAIMPTDQGTVTEKDSLPRGDRARALEADPQRSASRSFSHCSCSLTLDP